MGEFRPAPRADHDVPFQRIMSSSTEPLSDSTPTSCSLEYGSFSATVQRMLVPVDAVVDSPLQVPVPSQ